MIRIPRNSERLADVRYSPRCEWIGEGERCDCQSEIGRNYCEQHLWQVYQKGTNIKPRNRRKQELVDE